MNEVDQICALCGRSLTLETWQDYDDYGEEIQPAHERCLQNLRVWDSRLDIPQPAESKL